MLLKGTECLVVSKTPALGQPQFYKAYFTESAVAWWC